jgi:DNA polymerase-3 subunit gamma/tau
MATTAPDKIPDTIVSRSQVFEFKTISSRLIGEQLSKIAKADGIGASPEAIALVARSAEGSMRDAETAFDQVIAFAGDTVTAEDVAAVLGLVGRDLLFDVMTAVADENGPAAFELAGRAVEAGYELRLLCRELSRLVRDLLVLSVDESRFRDPDVAPEADHDRLRALLGRFSREDLLRSFDVLTRAENEVRAAAEPRYNFEMALLRWIHLRKLTPLADLIDRLESGAPLAGGTGPRSSGSPPPALRLEPSSSASVARKLSTAPARQAPPPARPPAPAAAAPAKPAARAAGDDTDPDPPAAAALADSGFKAALLAAIEKKRPMVYGTIVAQAQRIDVEGDRIVFRYGAIQTMLGDGVAREKAWLEELATGLAGRRISVAADVAKADPGASSARAAGRAAGPPEASRDLKAEAMKDPVVQSLLDVIPAEVKDITELKQS